MDEDLMIPGVIEDMIIPLVMAGALAAYIQMILRLEKVKDDGNKDKD